MDPETQLCLAQFDTHGAVGLLMCEQGGFEEMHPDLQSALAAVDFATSPTITMGALDPASLLAGDQIDLTGLGMPEPESADPRPAPILPKPSRGPAF